MALSPWVSPPRFAPGCIFGNVRTLYFILLFALTTACSAQTIYSINGTVVRTNDQAWILDSGSGWYGLLQFMDRPSADSEWTARTTVHFGTHSFTVRLPAIAVVVIGLISAASLILIATTVRGKVRKVHSHANAR